MSQTERPRGKAPKGKRWERTGANTTTGVKYWSLVPDIPKTLVSATEPPPGPPHEQDESGEGASSAGNRWDRTDWGSYERPPIGGAQDD